MRICLRNYETGSFFKSADSWTPDVNNAQEFANTGLAKQTARDLRLHKLEVVIIGDRGRILNNSRLDQG